MSYNKGEKQKEENMSSTWAKYRQIDGKLHRKASRGAENVALTLQGFNR